METSLFVSKFLTLLAMPVAATCMLLVLSLFFMLLGVRKLAFLSTTVSLLLLVVASLPITAERLGIPLERMYPGQLAAKAPAADAIIVLGGGVELPLSPRANPELNSSGDRIVEGARLYRAGRAPVVLLSGGNVFGRDGFDGESVYAAQLVAMLGVDPGAVVVESDSQTTFENAKACKSYLKKRGIRRTLLVTSASHMPRAVATFDSAGIEVIPAPADYRFTDDAGPAIMKFFPSANALASTSTMLHEYLGFFVYRWRGWISDDYGYRPEPSSSALALSQSASS